MKKAIVVVCTQLMAVFAFASVITNVTVRQVRPWSGLVEIGYDLTENIESMGSDGVLSLKISAIDAEHGQTYIAKSITPPTGFNKGHHRVVWDAVADDCKCVSTNIKFRVSVAWLPPEYCVVDLSAGASATSYPVTYLAAVPADGWDDQYKTTKLVLRYIREGNYKMQDEKNVLLTKPFYAGVFEITQKQYTLVMGSCPAQYKGDTRPVESVDYSEIRGGNKGVLWPTSVDVDESSFMGRLRMRTHLNFDLPTEAQWEYACRAGTTSKYNNGGSDTSDLLVLGRYTGNEPLTPSPTFGYDRGYHATVGTYLPNAWGLYDMHGNVWEWCLDYYGDLQYGTDPVGVTQGSYRVMRGGGCNSTAEQCTSSSRYTWVTDWTYFKYQAGFRAFVTMSE